MTDDQPQQSRPVTGHLTGAWRAGHPTGRYPGWNITVKFDADVVKALKKAVPWTHRTYDEETNIWWVDVKYEGALLQLFPGFLAYQSQIGFDL